MIGEILRKCRTHRYMTTRQVADVLGTSYQQIGRIENGKQDPKLSTLQRFAEALGYDLIIELKEKPEQ